MRDAKNQLFSKVRLIWAIPPPKIFIWSYISLPWKRLVNTWELRDKLGPGMMLKTRFLRLQSYAAWKNRFWGRNFDFSKISGNLFWACRSVEKLPLGSWEWFGTILDHLECIRSDLEQYQKLMFETAFLVDFATTSIYGMVLSFYVQILYLLQTQHVYFNLWKLKHFRS